MPILNNLPATDKCLRQPCKAQEDDDICRMLCHFCKEGWPRKVPGQVKQFKAFFRRAVSPEWVITL